MTKFIQIGNHIFNTIKIIDVYLDKQLLYKNNEEVCFYIKVRVENQDCISIPIRVNKLNAEQERDDYCKKLLNQLNGQFTTELTPW